jgi:hypothetical protein
MAKVMRGVHRRNREQAWGTSVSAPNTAGTQAYMGDDYDQGDNLYDEAWGPVESQAEAIAMQGYMESQVPTGPSYPVTSKKDCDCGTPNCDCK